MAPLEIDTYGIYNPLLTQSLRHCKSSQRKFISNHPDLTLNLAVHLNDSRCNSSSAEAGVLEDITGNGPIPPVGGTLYHWQRKGPSHYCTHQGSQRNILNSKFPYISFQFLMINI
ncbi:hypothetical protein AVEN_3210-1 [Araneus ventricosus]|uniref:Uncharacterized protein n=1 Tax=Araneus ventricosus TaxID=182803 RepID=A0A4Y2W414_ARAVE|nr:hypothetical protein AVEN_3210-1 [Araneus ventricosus]